MLSSFWGGISGERDFVFTVLASLNSNPNLRKAPVIKGPSKSLSMMIRAVGLKNVLAEHAPSITC